MLDFRPFYFVMQTANSSAVLRSTSSGACDEKLPDAGDDDVFEILNTKCDGHSFVKALIYAVIVTMLMRCRACQ